MAQTPWQDLIPYYVARSLPPPQMQAFEAQLARDTDLRQEVDEWRRIAAGVWREADAAARHLPPLSPEIYKQLQYRNGAQPVNPTVPLAAPRVRQTSLAGMNGSPLMFVAGFLVVFLCGGILLFSAMRGLQPEVLTTPAANGTQNGFAVAMGQSATPAMTECMVGFQTNVPGCVSATAPSDSTWTPAPHASSTPVIVRPFATITPRPPVTPTPAGLAPQVTKDPINRAFTQTAIAVFSVSTVWPDYQCTATNTSGDVLPMYARADYSQVVGDWPAGSSLPVSAAMYGFWVQIGYGQWVPTNGVTLAGPCDGMPGPTPTAPAESTATDQCVVINTTQSPVPLYGSVDNPTQIVSYLPIGEIQGIIAYSNSGWYEVYYNGQSGWFRPEGLTFQGNCSFIPLASPTDFPTQTWTPGPTPVQLQSVFNATTRAVTVAQTVLYVIPDRGGPIQQGVDGGTEWRAVGIAVVGGTEWVSIITWDGAQAWIERSLVTIVDISIPTPSPELPPSS